MNINLIEILPIAVRWVKEHEEIILKDGVPLSGLQIAYAKQLGIVNVDKVKILYVNNIPKPQDTILAEACEQTQLITDDTAGLTLNYEIYLRSDCENDLKLIVHELMHVAQYERLGSIHGFLGEYLHEVLSIGYHGAPMEQEAIQAEKLVNIIPKTHTY